MDQAGYIGTETTLDLSYIIQLFINVDVQVSTSNKHTCHCWLPYISKQGVILTGRNTTGPLCSVAVKL